MPWNNLKALSASGAHARNTATDASLLSQPAPDTLAGELSCDVTGFCNNTDQDLSLGYKNSGDQHGNE
jgi:hypothetical protein